MKIRGTAALMLAALCIALPAQGAAKRTIAVAVEGTPLVAADRYVVMVGEGEVKAMPDTAVVSGGVVTKARDASDALHDNAQAMAKVIAALKALGITDKQIATSSIGFQPVYPPYDPKTGQSNKVIGYQVSNSLRVTLSDLSRAGEVLDALIDNGANQYASIGFEIKDRAALEEKARVEAGKDALKRAMAYAGSVGAELGTVRSIREGMDSSISAEDIGAFPDRYVGGALARLPSPPPPPPPGTMVQAGEQTISATVTVVWALK